MASHLKSYLRRRKIFRSGAWLTVLVVIITGLWIANRVLPSRTFRSASPNRVIAVDPVTEGTVQAVLDGDSLRLVGGIEVRLKGIDAPEKDRPGSDEAREALGDLVLDRRLNLAYDDEEKVDRYGRLLAFVSVTQGECVNEQLLRRGRVWIYKLDRDSDRGKRFLSAQREAMDADRGIWARLAHEEGPYTGNRSSRVFHKRDCRFGKNISPKNREAFESLRQAYWEGYSPCRRCLRRPLEGL